MAAASERFTSCAPTYRLRVRPAEPETARSTQAEILRGHCSVRYIEALAEDQACCRSTEERASVWTDWQERAWHPDIDITVMSTSQWPNCVPRAGSVPLPPKCSELNPQENIWQFRRDNHLSNSVFYDHADPVDHCCDVWTRLEAQTWHIMLLDLRDQAHGF